MLSIRVLSGKLAPVNPTVGVTTGCGLIIPSTLISETMNLLELCGVFRSSCRLALGRRLLKEKRLKYVDIVTDTLHPSSSDLITWNALAMLGYSMVHLLKREWLVVASVSLGGWNKKEPTPSFQIWFKTSICPSATCCHHLRRHSIWGQPSMVWYL